MPASSDVIVIGGGFAGVTAARDLSRSGYSTVLLEAKDHIGGRAWSRPFAGRDVEIAVGGEYVYPERQASIAREVERYGRGYEQPPDTRTYVNLVGGQRIEGGSPVPFDEWPQLERGLYHCLRAAEGIDPTLPIEIQLDPSRDISFNEFIAPLGLPAATRDYLVSFAHLCGGRSVNEYSVMHLVNDIAHLRHGVLGMHLTAVKIGGGNRALCESILADSDADLCLGEPVISVSQTPDDVTVSTNSQEYNAAVAVVAIPANLWGTVEFDPPLSEEKLKGSAMRPGGTTQKVWAVVQGAPPDFLGIGNPEQGAGISYVATDAHLEDGQLMYALAPEPSLFDGEDEDSVRTAFKAYMPACTIVAFDGHNWNTDPWADGGWAGYPAGLPSRYLSRMREPEGRLVFAGADIALIAWGWIAGAIESGTIAGSRAASLIESRRVAVTR
ncbi:MAG: flavin monoamine oxidase family protein [Pseudonocardiales bacterium]